MLFRSMTRECSAIAVQHWRSRPSSSGRRDTTHRTTSTSSRFSAAIERRRYLEANLLGNHPHTFGGEPHYRRGEGQDNHLICRNVTWSEVFFVPIIYQKKKNLCTFDRTDLTCIYLYIFFQIFLKHKNELFD